MKTRQGFVSNSSSSSFIIKTKEENGYVKIKAENFGEVLRTKEEVKKHLVEYYDCDVEEWSDYENEKYGKYLDIIDSGNIIIIGSIEYGAEEDFERVCKDLDMEWDE